MNEPDDAYVTYCGLYCENCAQRARVGPEAAALRESMRRLGYEGFGPMIPDFEAFWGFLSELARDGGCRGCRAGGGNPYCKIRECARKKGASVCALCGEYPCGEYEEAFAAYPMLRDDNRFLKENGLEAWEAMQRRRRARGYTYTEENERLKG